MLIPLAFAGGVVIETVANNEGNSLQKVDKSIAVLPFENFSDDREDRQVADSIHEGVLKSLSKLRDLKVVPRDSVMEFRSKSALDHARIGSMLGVSTILEGSVRKSGNRVRVSVQLIEATNDRHLWAQVYDRDWSEVAAIQEDLTRDIANILHVKTR
jgi:adenylate cyclase